MCTSIIYDSNGQHYFGRNLDLEISFGEHPVIMCLNIGSYLIERQPML